MNVSHFRMQRHTYKLHILDGKKDDSKSLSDTVFLAEN